MNRKSVSVFREQRVTERLIQRRDALRQGLLGAAAMAVPTIISAQVISAQARGADNAPPPSDRISLGVIGLGARGVYVMNQFLAMPDVRIVAVCDVDALHYRDNPPGRGSAYGWQPAKSKIDDRYQESGAGVFATTDFRELCQRTDLDAVLIATPDHWHALVTQTALQHGLDVYCEKPVTHTFHEGQLIYREVAQRNAVFQTGSQQRSDAKFRRAVELVRNGHVGKIRQIEVGLPPGYAEPQGDPTITEPPAGLDYDRWCGPAPLLPYMRARHHRWWRGHRAFGGGVLMDWIGHHNDIAHWALDLDAAGPSMVEAVDWTFPETEIYNTPANFEIRCEYADGCVSSIANRHPLGTKFIGDDGWLYVNRGKLQASNPNWTKQEFDVGPRRVYESDNHVRNFLDCIKSRTACIAPPETAHRSITPGHLGYVSQALGRPLRWDWQQEWVIGDEEANRILAEHHYRAPWS
jgi:predicted dehydrogenase